MILPRTHAPWFRLCLRLLRDGAALAVLCCLLVDRGVTHNATARVLSSPSSEGDYSVALVLGTASHISDGRPNRFFVRRIAAAAELFHSGAVRGLVLSGDNGRHDYNEPEAMRQALLAAGVPEEAITCDYAGFRTLDSIVRMEHIFGQRRYLIVSQRDHLERALLIADAHGHDCQGYAARDVDGLWGLRVRSREIAARVLAFLDCFVLGTEPRFYGPPVAVGLVQRR